MEFHRLQKIDHSGFYFKAVLESGVPIIPQWMNDTVEWYLNFGKEEHISNLSISYIEGDMDWVCFKFNRVLTDEELYTFGEP